MDNSILNAALKYAARGWSVLPVNRLKQPLIKWEKATREELTDPDNIRKWWKQFPSANVAIVTGKRSGGLVVIDLDIDDEKGKNGKEALRDWCDENYVYGIDSPATVVTGRGGQHLYFQTDEEYIGRIGVLDSVDIRAEGNIIVAPPSIHGGTRREYFWDIDTEEPEVPKANSDVIYFLSSMDAKAKLEEEREKKKIDFTEITEEGGRNDKLFKYAAKLQGEGETDEAIREYAEVYNKTHLKPPLGDDEVRRTIESVLSHTEWKGSPKEQPKEQPKPEHPRTFRKLKTAEALMEKDLPDPEVYVGIDDELPLLVEGTCILSAKPKLGKSWFALCMCLAVSSGADFLGYKTKKCSTLYLDLETSEVLQQRRLKKALHGQPVPKNFYLETETDTIGKGFCEQIEAYLAEDPNIGIVVIDVFQIIRSPVKSFKETEYEHAYRDITPLNELAQKHHISIVLVCHDRKAVDPDDPFSNILGSTGLQGAATQMMVMFRKKKGDPIHISIKGKTIDGLPELNVNLDNAEWSISEEKDPVKEREEEYFGSDVRAAVLAPAEGNFYWKGRCSTLINDALDLGVPITESPKEVGGFLHRYRGMFLKDKVKVEIINNGTGPKLYRIQKFTIDTIDGNKQSTIDEWQEASKYKASEIPFL